MFDLITSRVYFLICTFLLLHIFVHPSYAMNFESEHELETAVSDRLDKAFNTSGVNQGVSSLDIAQLILDVSTIGDTRGRLEELISTLDKMQISSILNPNFGNFIWRYGDSEVKDRNAVEFVVRYLTVALIENTDRFESGHKLKLKEILAKANVAIGRHLVRVEYTNIYLMKSWNLISSGIVLNDNSLRRTGERLLKEWYDHVSRVGIDEFLSPEYYSENLSTLALMDRYGQGGIVKEVSEKGLSMLWCELAANWFAAGGRLSGVNSRSYDWLDGYGAVYKQVQSAGILDALPIGVSAGYKSVFADLTSTTPNSMIRKFFSGVENKLVFKRNGIGSESNYINYISEAFSIASSGEGYCDHDNSTVVAYLGGARSNRFYYVMTDNSDPYGHRKTYDARLGHYRIGHVNPFRARIQNFNEVVFIASGQSRDSTGSLESDFLIPAGTSVWIDNQQHEFGKSVDLWDVDPSADSVTTFAHAGKNETDVLDGLFTLEDLDKTRGVGVSKQFPAKEENVYFLEGEIEGVGGVYVYLNFYDENMSLIGREDPSFVAARPGEYIKVSRSATAPKNTRYMKALIYSTIADTNKISGKSFVLTETTDNGNTSTLGYHLGLPPERYQSREFRIGNTVYLRKGDVVLAMRILGAWTGDTKVNTFELVSDPTIGRLGRISLRHKGSSGERGKGGVAVWVYVADEISTEREFADFREQLNRKDVKYEKNRGVVNVKVDGVNGVYELVTDVERKRILKKIGGYNVRSEGALFVNGKEMSAVCGY